MSVAANLQNLSAPSENWDDDFDFHSQSGSPKRPNDTYGRPPTRRMSTATEDWDVDHPVASNSIMHYDLARPNNILADKLNTTLADWVEDGPSTPQKPSLSAGFSTENWDDDFLDKADSPIRQSPRATLPHSRSSISGKLRAGVPLHHRKPHGHYEEEEHENWDDEFNFRSSPFKPGESSTPRRPQNALARRPACPLPPRHDHYISDDDDDDDADFGSATAEEDRTVTARSRRAPQQHTPPPPVPSIPFTLTPTTSAPSTSTTTYTHLSAPFPRSPTASVFSVPTSSVADTTSLRSTAPLRPSLTRISASNALKHLPPSPPIHRERRRLRKKSRPQQEGVFELVDMNSHYPPFYSEPEQRLEEVDERRTPSPLPITPESIAVNVPSTPSNSAGSGGAILSRMGSIKSRWTGRKKKASLTPSEVSKYERRKDSPDNVNEYPTPRPRSSRSSLLHSAQAVPPPSSSWFFRPSSPTRFRHRNSLGKGSNPRSSYTGSRSGSMTDLSMRGSTASSSNYGNDDDSLSRKLPKRKSLGFVQFQNGLLSNGFSDKGKMGDDESDSDALKRSASKRPMSMQAPSPSTFRPSPSLRQTSYTTPKGKQIVANTDDLHEGDTTELRERKQSTPKAMRLRAKDQAKGRGKEKERDEGKANAQEEEGNRGFMRRLSFVGRHRRTKSGASMSNVEPMERVPSESLVVVPPDILPADKPPSLPPIPPFLEIRMPPPPSPPSSSTSSLLPPIELRPPSPPQNFKLIKTDTIKANDDSMSPNLSPTSPSFARDAIIPNPTSASIPSASLAHHVKPLQSAKCSQTPKLIPSGYTASLGRASISPKNSLITDVAQRRNSLSDLKSDLKIPARISQAQQGLKRDLGMVRDFAVYIDQLKKQQERYNDLLLQMQQKLDAQAQLAQQPVSRAVSPSFFNLTKPQTRARSNTNPLTPGTRYKELAAALYAINSRYRISWECAELLIDLADGTTSTDGAPPTSASAPVVLGSSGEKRGRERAITLGGGDKSKPSTPTPGMSSSMIFSSSTSSCPPPASPPAWRASTGRHDLSHRQLVLLREMLNNAEAVLSTTDGSGLPLSVPEETTPSSTTDSLRINRDWRWGHPMSSTITLPSEDANGVDSQKKKYRVSKLVGMAGLREILRVLKMDVTDSALGHDLPPPPRLTTVHNHTLASTPSLATDMSSDLPKPKDQVQGRLRKLSSGPEAAVRKEGGRNPTPSSIEIPVPSKPRRPSLASIFRIGSRKNTPPSMSVTDLPTQYSDRECSEPSRPGTGLGSHDQNGMEEDWDKIDSASDLDAAAKSLADRETDGMSTLKKSKGKSPYLQYRAPSSSTSQLVRPSTPRRSASGSQLSIWAESPSKVRSRTPNHAMTRAPRLSNVDENTEGTKSKGVQSQLRKTSSRTSGRIQKSGSIRSMPSQSVLSESRLAMTPDNIKPLLENAKEVHARLVDCIMEIQQLLESDGAGEISVSGPSCASASRRSFLS